MPAASWPRFCRSSSMRGISRETCSGPPVPDRRAVAAARQVVDRRDAAFVVQLVHVTARQEESEFPRCYWNYRTYRGRVQERVSQPAPPIIRIHSSRQDQPE